MRMDEESFSLVQPGTSPDATFRWICDRSAEGIMVAEAQSRRIVYANAAACRMFGYEPAEPVGMRVDSFHPADALPSFLLEFAAFAHGQPRAAFPT
jgi:PAS domain S-box-containing protein